jgi:tRNA A-37 threonylcarbamoyl transferase component Bud32
MNKHRAYNKSFIENNSFIKLSQEDRLYDEICFYQQISKYPQGKIFAEFKNNLSNGYTYALELLNYKDCKNLAQYMLNENSQKMKLCEYFDAIIYSFNFLHVNPKSNIPKEYYIDTSVLSSKMLIEKTHNEFIALTKNEEMSILCNYQNLIINDKQYLNFDKIWPVIESIIKDQYCKFDLTFIHGDACLSNMIIDSNNSIIFVDPRGSYGLKGCFGDKAYDYAKLMHSLEGNYEQIIYDMFELNHKQNSVFFTFKYDISFLMNRLQECLEDSVYKKSKLIQGLIFIGMCARHYDSIDRQKIMYCTGIKILNDWLNENT